MSRLNDSGALALGAVAAAMFSVGMSLAVVACGSSSGANDAGKADSQARAVVPIASVGGAVAARGVEALSASAVASAIATPAVAVPKAPARMASAEGLSVKRFVVANKIQDREPVLEQGALLANGKPIYAFAELANETADAAQVRITFERKGSTDRVGNVTLSVPAKAGRYRTWGNTRFVREAGTWEAVLWTESGKELGRAEFEVAGS